MRAEHGVLSAEELFAQVWDEHVDPFTNTVHVTPSRLRRKLGEPAAIETVPGVGYRVTETDGAATRCRAGAMSANKAPTPPPASRYRPSVGVCFSR